MTDIVIKQGATFKRTYRWVMPPVVYKPATITATIPLTVEATGHGMPAAWPAKLLGPEGTTDEDTCGEMATALDADTVEFNSVVDSSYQVGDTVTLAYMTPVTLTGFSAEMQIRSSARATTPLLTISSDGVTPGIVMDNATGTITVTITSAQTAALSFSNAVFQIEMTSLVGEVTRLDDGACTLSREVVRV